MRQNIQTNKHGKAKGKNSILTFEKHHMVRKKVRTWFLLFKKKIPRERSELDSYFLRKKSIW